MNPIQPLPASSPDISVTLPVSQAIDRVKRVLFQPFDLGKWFVIGFCAWLAQLGERGGGNFNFNSGGGHGHGGSLRPELDHAWSYVLHNLYWILPVTALVAVLGIGLWLVFTWLNSRGKFMFLHCVAQNRAEVAVPWTRYGRQADSLFLFRIVLGLVGAVLFIPLVVLMVVVGVATFAHGHVEPLGIAGLVVLALGLIGLAVVFGLIAKLTIDFVVPIMAVRGCSCWTGWGVLRRLIAANLGHVLLYLLFQIVIGMVVGTLVLMVMVLTCCCCCLLLLPYVGTVLLLPVLVFQRAYSAHYLAQYGRDFDVFPAA
jgi:hypothetical protein